MIPTRNWKKFLSVMMSPDLTSLLVFPVEYIHLHLSPLLSLSRPSLPIVRIIKKIVNGENTLRRKTTSVHSLCKNLRTKKEVRNGRFCSGIKGTIRVTFLTGKTCEKLSSSPSFSLTHALRSP